MVFMSQQTRLAVVAGVVVGTLIFTLFNDSGISTGDKSENGFTDDDDGVTRDKATALTNTQIVNPRPPPPSPPTFPDFDFAKQLKLDEAACAKDSTSKGLKYLVEDNGIFNPVDMEIDPSGAAYCLCARAVPNKAISGLAVGPGAAKTDFGWWPVQKNFTLYPLLCNTDRPGTCSCTGTEWKF
eukprot:m.11985 g.11985  ORF g.11985 m.11985 type:complete len:183 (-) comp9090_c0_seq1:174-722(-)